METTFNKSSIFRVSAKQKENIFELITYLFIALFVYTASSKIMTHDKFATMLGKSPSIGAYNEMLSWLIPGVELVISGVLLISRTKRLGLMLSLGLMVIFTVYLIYMVSLDVKLPCLCGGVVEMLSWRQHIVFNAVFIALAFFGLKLRTNRY